MVTAGKLTQGDLRGPVWRRLFRDVYACPELPITHRVRALAASRLLVPGSVVTGRSAAALWGVLEARPDDPIELTVPPGSNASLVSGIVVRRRVLDPRHVTRRDGVRTTSAEWTAVDLARTGPLDDAAVLIDQFVNARVTVLPDIAALAATTTGFGCRQVREAVRLADGLAGSPQETRLRLLLHRSSLPEPVAQFVVRDRGVFLARVDFAWPAAKVAVEYEGVWHGETPQQVAADRRRLNRLTAAGWTVIFVTAADLHHPERLLARLALELSEVRPRRTAASRGRRPAR
jgi:very-short-patch-repair endonuclease